MNFKELADEPANALVMVAGFICGYILVYVIGSMMCELFAYHIAGTKIAILELSQEMRDQRVSENC